MKHFMSAIVTLIASAQAHAIHLVCEEGEIHIRNTAVLEDTTGECPSGFRISLSANHMACAQFPPGESLKRAGQYQVCGHYDQNKDVMFVRWLADARLR